MDLQKAYSVPIIKLWEILQQTTINHTLIKAAQNLYEEMKYTVKTGNARSKMFIINKGLRQGCCISPTLFKIYIAKALQQWKKKCSGMGIQIDNNSYLYTLQFANDQVICANNNEDLEYMGRKLKEEYERWGLEMNLEKTQYLCTGEETTDLQLGKDGKVKTCDEYKSRNYF